MFLRSRKIMVADAFSISASSYDKNSSKDENMFSCLLKRMNPGFCLCAQTVDDSEYEFNINLDQIDATESKLDQIMEGILIDIDSSNSSTSRTQTPNKLDDKISALNTLYQMSGVKSNPYVCAQYIDEQIIFANSSQLDRLLTM